GNLPAVTVPSCGVLDLRGLRFVVTPTGAGGSGGGSGAAGSGGSSGTAGAGGGSGAGGRGGASGTGGAAGTGGGTGPCDAMPLFPPNLTAAELDCVQRWANGLTK